jgi:Flp pilus assembly protein TadG
MNHRIRVADTRRRLAEKPRAQVMMLISVALVVVLGMAALAVDVGNLWTTRRRMQSAADAAAMAGVDALTVGETGTAISSAAQLAATQNGFTNGSTTGTSTSAVSVVVYNPPRSGLYQGLSSAVQVVVSQSQPTYFMRVLGWRQVPVSTSATALAVGSGSCVFALSPSASGAVTVNGTTSLNSQCGLYDNSDSSTALTVSGGGTLTAPFVGVVGSTSVNGGGSTPPTSGIPAFGDPLSWVTQPTYDSDLCPQGSFHQTSLNGTVSPGYFCGGIHIAGGATVNFSPGLYIIDGGGIQIDGGANVSGSGVTFFLTGQNTSNGSPNAYGGVNIASNANVNLSAPCTSSGGGQVGGILFFQDRSITNGVGSTINGSSTSTFNGALYFPTTPLTYAGSTAANMFTLLVSNTLTIDGTANVGNGTCLQGCCMQGPMIRDARLVQ